MLTPRITLLTACSVILAACSTAPVQEQAQETQPMNSHIPQAQAPTYITQQRPAQGMTAQQYAMQQRQREAQQQLAMNARRQAQQQASARPPVQTERSATMPRPSLRRRPPILEQQRQAQQEPSMIAQAPRLIQRPIMRPAPPRNMAPPPSSGTVQFAAGRMYTGPGQFNRLPDVVAAKLRADGIAEHGFSAYVRPASAGAPALLTANADMPRNPASTMKLVTTYTTLGVLGPDYRWPTEIYTAGAVNGGVLYGDVIIKGYGDPTFSENDFRNLLQALRGRGINAIKGNLIADSTFFSVPNTNEGAFDGNVGASYNAIPEAILYQERGGCYEFTNLKGKIERICPVLPTNASARADLNTNLFGGFWKIWVGEMRGRMDGQFVRGVTPSNAQLVYTNMSRPARDIIMEVNKDSNNVMARQLLLSVGAKQFGAPGTPQKGAQAVGQFLESRGLSFDELRIENGSGLSRIERISARHMGELLADAYNSPYRNEFMNSLAVLGVDGTLKNRMKGSPLTGRGKFKTGTLRDVRALAGYLQAANGQTYIVSVLHNDPRARTQRDAQDELVEWVYWGPRNNYAMAY